MSDRKRLHRVDPARVGPVRDFSKLYSRAEFRERNPSCQAGPGRCAAQSRRRSVGEGRRTCVQRDRQVYRRGRQTAEGFSSQPYATRATNDNLQDVLERTVALPDRNASALDRDARHTGEGRSVAKRSRAGAGSQAAASQRREKADTMAVSIEVVSVRPVQVSIELQPNSEAQSLVSLGLNAVDSSKPALRDISLVPDEVPGRIKLRLRIPESQPAGIYSGVIVNREQR